MTAGFYKKENETLFYAPNIIEAEGYVLVAQDKDQYEYPIDGWTWFDSEEEAKSLLDTNHQEII
jgi:hypothetical protein